MQPDLALRRQEDSDQADRLADILYELAGDQDVRVIEALAAVFANRRTSDAQEPEYGLCEAAAPSGFDGTEARPHLCARRAICRRVARRAARGSLVDPTRGANAVHRIEESPAWSRDLLPIGAFGPFLFYRLTQARQGIRDGFLPGSDGCAGPSGPDGQPPQEKRCQISFEALGWQSSEARPSAQATGHHVRDHQGRLAR